MGATINVKGSYIDIHGNQHVHLRIDGAKVHLGEIETKANKGIEQCIADPTKAEALRAVLHELIDGRKGKDVAMVVQCATKMVLLRKTPTHAQMVEEFGDIGTRSGYYRYLDFDFLETETQYVVQKLNEV